MENPIFQDTSTNFKSNIRYVLSSKMMKENFITWISQPTTLTLIERLLEDCKKPSISLVIIISNVYNIVNTKSNLAHQDK